MASLNTNPTRMELIRLKARLKTTVRGHKLLKDRVDEMVRQFLKYIQQNKQLRQQLEAEIVEALRAFAVSQTLMTPQQTEQAIAMPSFVMRVDAGFDTVMGIDVPKLKVNSLESAELYPYSFSSTVSQFDKSIAKMTGLIKQIAKLAEVEKTCDILAGEIEKVRRRANALEQFVIPQIREEMKRISMKLDENERSNLVRLMKVKEMISEQE